MSEIHSTVEPTDTEPWRVSIRQGRQRFQVDLPNPGADPVARHAQAVLQVTGLEAIHRVRETPRGYVWAEGLAPELGQPTYQMTASRVEEQDK